MPSLSRILIVDDQPGLAALLARNLQAQGHSARALTHPKEVLAVIHEYDVLVTDYHLPEMSGLELAREAYRQGWRGALLLMSGHVGAIDEILEHPLLRVVLQKPFSTQTLVKAVTEFE